MFLTLKVNYLSLNVSLILIIAFKKWFEFSHLGAAIIFKYLIEVTKHLKLTGVSFDIIIKYIIVSNSIYMSRDL